MTLNKEQTMAFQHIIDGHSLVLLGPAGTGKSYIVQKTVDTLQGNGKTVYVTATTGIACRPYKSATTIHRWSGIGDGRHSMEDIHSVILNNKQYGEVKERIIGTDVLIIDECSMLSVKFLESVNAVCQLRNPKLLFGGIQVVLVGDFRQLAPVPNTLLGDAGELCFTSKLFPEMFKHKIALKHVIRQNERELVKAIEECSMRCVSQETENYINRLNRPLPEEMDRPTMLFSTNELVDDYNRRSIIDHAGVIYEFNAEDSGEKRYLDRITVPKVLWLKLGAPVILMRNLTDKLVNGLQGYIGDITENGPVVRFPHEEIPIPKVKCTVFHPSKNTDVAVREQYPLKLAFAISIHKSQGMTLNRVEVNCKGIFKPGQFGVAIGRCRSGNGLRVVNFTPSVCLAQPVEVQHFMSNITSSPCLHDKSCCQVKSSREHPKVRVTVSDMLDICDVELENTADSEVFDEEFDNDIMNIDQLQTENDAIQLPEDLNIDTILQKLRCEHVITPQQFNNNTILENINKSKLKSFVKNEFVKMKNIIQPQQKMAVETHKVAANVQCQFYREVHMYQTGVEFQMNCLSLFNDCPFNEQHLHICFNISNSVRKYLIEKQVHLLTLSKRNISNRTVTNASMSRIRYVGGYCIAKVNYKLSQKKKSTMYKTDYKSVNSYEEAVVCTDILSELKVNEQYLLTTTSLPDTLLDTDRRQTSVNRSLTNISDSLFHFFKELTEICLTLLTDEKLNKQGEKICEYVHQEIVNNKEMKQKFMDVVKKNNSVYSESCLQNHCEVIYRKIIKLHSMVMMNQFRKDLLESFNVEKKMSHRKQILVSKTGDKRKVAPKSKTKSKRKCVKPNEQELDQTSKVSGTSTVVEQDEDDEAVDCLVCLKPQLFIKGKLETDWIQCDNCDGWIHRSCAGLKHHMRWRKVSASAYYCKQCQ